MFDCREQTDDCREPTACLRSIAGKHAEACRRLSALRFIPDWPLSLRPSGRFRRLKLTRSALCRPR